MAWNLTRKFRALACLSAGLVFYCHAVSAAALSVAVAPTQIDIVAPPGAQVTESVKFWNGTDGELPVHVQPEDIRQGDEEGHVLRGEEDPANSLRDWVRPQYPDVTVFPKQEITLNFTIDVPPNADPGTHWGGLAVSTAGQPSGAGAAIQAHIGTIILVRVLGDAKEQLTLDSFSVPPFLQGPPLELEARFKNEGTVHEAPQGAIEVRNMFGWLVATGTLPVRNVLPGTVRKVSTQVGNGIWLGRYTVSLSARYGDGNEELNARAEVWAVPWRTQGWKVLVAILFLALVIQKRKSLAWRFGCAWHVLRTGEAPPED